MVEILPATAAHTPEWHDARRHGIGGSDILACVGAHPYMTPIQLWQAKAFNTQVTETDAMRHGRILEPVVAEMFSDHTGLTLTKTGTWAHDQHPHHRANPDYLIGDDSGLEIKTTAPSPEAYAEWQRQPAAAAAAQAQWCMHVTGRSTWWVACWMYGYPLITHLLQRDDDLIGLYMDAADTMWQHVQTMTPPAGEWSKSEVDALAIAFPPQRVETGEAVEIAVDDPLAEALDRRRDLVDEKKAIEKQINQIDKDVKLRMGTADELRIAGDPKPRVTWRAHSRDTLDTKALKAHYYEIYDECLNTTTYRTYRA